MQASDDPAPPSASDRRRVLIVECVLVATVAIYAASNLPGVRAHAGYSVA
ncbi:MAG TPA: hypothetical protein VLR26_06100 [Frankiaceae bacterium]|nr:hypothetical protein [Frankiaceae bacterium]